MRLTIVILLAFITVAPLRAQEIDATEQELESLRVRIETLRKRRETDLRERDGLQAALRDAETAEAAVISSLAEVRASQQVSRRRSAELEGEVRDQRARIDKESDGIDAQLRIAWMSGQEEWLKLVLSLEDPAVLGRQLLYQGYLVRSRADSMARYGQDLERLSELQVTLAGQQAKLADLESQRMAQLERRRAVRADRATALTALSDRVESGDTELQRLSRQAADLETLLADLLAARASFGAGDSGFEQSRGALGWPAPGRLAAQYGALRAGGPLRWNGILIEADAGTPVRAVHDGRVIYSGWLPGMGMLAVVDHGGGFLSLYGHNQNLACEVGEIVAAGQVIGAVGDTGGQTEPGLYFEIRKDGEPVDPANWTNTP
jgi:septal ring factor EnvC (AmiA/AmiB activator)